VFVCGVGAFLALYYLKIEWTIDRVATMVISLAGIWAGVFFFWFRPQFLDDKDEHKQLTREIRTSLSKIGPEDSLEAVLKDYETTQKEIDRRENITLIVGTILITGSLIILGNTATAGARVWFPYAFPSILLYVIWLFVLHLTTARLDSVAFKRAGAIETAIATHFGYDFGIHEYTLKSMKNKKGRFFLWVDTRRGFWGIILIALSASWLIIAMFK
jgi:hypothetical protein